MPRILYAHDDLTKVLQKQLRESLYPHSFQSISCYFINKSEWAISGDLCFSNYFVWVMPVFDLLLSFLSCVGISMVILFFLFPFFHTFLLSLPILISLYSLCTLPIFISLLLFLFLFLRTFFLFVSYSSHLYLRLACALRSKATCTIFAVSFRPRSEDLLSTIRLVSCCHLYSF